MKTFISTISLTSVLFLINIGLTNAQTLGFTQEDIVKQAGVKTDAGINSLSLAYRQSARTYYDGMGRPIQAIGIQASPEQNDMIQPVAYDNLGRQTTKYLPYTGQSTDVTASYRPNAVSTDQPNFYNGSSHIIANDAAPHSETVFENTPLQRILDDGMVGTGYQPTVTSPAQHYKTVSYRSNSTSDGNIWVFNPDGTYTAGTYFGVNVLSVSDAKDEDGVEVLIFKDIAGHVILKRQMTPGGTEAYLDTYYVYNNAGNIAFIVPPEAMTLLQAHNTYTLTTTPVSTLVFGYSYDAQGRVSSKTVPGSGMLSIVYDPLNRPLLLQNPNLAAANQWYYIKYDAKSRPVSYGIYTATTNYTQSAMQTYANGQYGSSAGYESRSSVAVTYYYTNTIFPSGAQGTGTISPLSFNFYDDYNLHETSPATALYTYSGPSIFNGSGYTTPEGAVITQPTPTTSPITGMPTMQLNCSVGSGFTSTIWLMKVMFYDQYGHVIQVQSSNQLNIGANYAVSDANTTVPDFTGKPLANLVTKVTGSGVNNTNTILTIFSYDADNTRLQTVDQQYNSQPIATIASYTYNELGQLILKNLSKSGSTFLQSVDFRYNIRGQITTINNSTLTNDNGVTNSDGTDVFGMQILYDGTDSNLGSGDIPSYSGRVSAVKWMSKNSNNVAMNERSYIYSYDKLGRYVGAYYAERQNSGSSFNYNLDGFDENSITYDENGNIKTLKRNTSQAGGTGVTISMSQMDNLTYSYDPNNPNHLQQVFDASSATAGFVNPANNTATNYSYDANGNLTGDPYKGLTIGFNYLNKTDHITFGPANTTLNGAHVNYTYNSSGAVIRKQTYSAGGALLSTNDYIDGFVYITPAGGNALLSYLPMPEGRAVNTSGSAVVLTAEYVITDPQGNARFSFRQNSGGALQIWQEDSYYGMGEVMNGTPVNPQSPSNINLYNGASEWQNEFNTLPDYNQAGDRNYDPILGRFIAVDPSPESAESMTTYQYAGNNPVMNNDPGGDKAAPYSAPQISPMNWSFAYGVSGAVQAHFDAEMGITDDVWSGFNGGGWASGAGGSGFGDDAGGGGDTYGAASIAAITPGIDGGVYATDPGRAQYLANTLGTRIYQANDGTSSNGTSGNSTNNNGPLYGFTYQGTGVLYVNFAGNNYAGYSISKSQGNNGLIMNFSQNINAIQIASLFLNQDSWAPGFSSYDLTQDANQGGEGGVSDGQLETLASGLEALNKISEDVGANKLAAVTEYAGYGLTALNVVKGYKDDKYKYGAHTQNALQHAAASTLGATYGAYAGGTAGFLIAGPAGAWVGAIIGGAVGGWVGNEAAKEFDQPTYDNNE